MLFFVFGIIGTFIWIFQFVFAILENVKQSNNVIPDDFTPNISVVIPTFNENNQILEMCIRSVLDQKKCNVDIIVVNDGSNNFVTPILHDNIRYVTVQHGGKRLAQAAGFKLAKYDLIATTDSDTILDEYAIRNLAFTVMSRKAGAATGSVFLLNEKDNLLTKMTSCLYWVSFFQERASQSFFNCVTCCSGALSIYRRDIILKNLDIYINQFFMGDRSLSGDDRHMTNIFLLDGQKVIWSKNSKSYTVSPNTMKRFLNQQIRWAKSSVREMLFIIQNINKSNFWMLFFNLKLFFNYIYQTSLYFAILATFSLHYLLVCIIISAIIGAIRGMVAFIYTGSFKFAYMIIYTLYSFLIYNPVILYGVFLKNIKWRS